MSVERLRQKDAIIRNLRERLSDNKKTCAAKLTAQKNTTREVKEQCKIKKDEIKEDCKIKKNDIKEDCKIKKNAIRESLKEKLIISREHHAPGARQCHRDLADANRRLDERQRQHDELQETLHDRTEERDNLIQARNDLQAQLAILNEGGNPVERIAQLQGQLQVSAANLVNVQRENAQRAEQIQQLTTQRDALQRDLEGINQSLPVIQEELQTVTAQKVQLQTDVDRVRREKLALEQQMEDVNARFLQANQANQANQARFAALESANQQQRTLIEEKTQFVTQSEHRLQEQNIRIDILTRERDEARTRVQTLQHQLDDCNRESESCRTSLDQAHTEMSGLQKEMAALRAQIDSLTGELKRSRTQTAESVKKGGMYRKQYEEVNTKLLQHNQRIMTLDNEIAKLQDELQQCKRQKDNATTRLMDQDDQIAKLEAAMANNASLIQQLETANRQYTDQLEQTNKEHTERTRGIQKEHSSLVQELRTRLEELQENHTSSLARLHSLESEHTHDTTEKAQLQHTIQGLTERTNQLHALLEECNRIKDTHLGQLNELSGTSSSEKERLVALHQADIEELRRRNESLSTSLSIETEYKERLIKELALVKAKLANKESEFKAEEEAMKRRHTSQIEEMKQTHQKDLERVSSRNESVKLLTDEHAKTLQMMRDSHQKDLSELERSHQANVTALKDEHLQIIAALKKETVEMDAQLKQKDQEFNIQQTRLDKESGMRTAAQQQVDALKRQFEESERLLELKAQEKVSTVSTMLHQQIDALKQKLQVMEGEKKAFEQKTQRLGEIEAALQAARNLSVNERRQAEDSMEQIKTQHELEQQKLATRHQQELARITTELATCNATLPAHESMLAELRREVSQLQKISSDKDVVITSTQRLIAEKDELVSQLSQRAALPMPSSTLKAMPRVQEESRAFSAPERAAYAAGGESLTEQKAPEASPPLSAQEASRKFSRFQEFKENPMILQNLYKEYGIMPRVQSNSLQNFRGTYSLWPTVDSNTCIKTSCYKPYYDLLQKNATEGFFVIIENWYGGIYPYKVEPNPNACKLIMKHTKGTFMFDIEFIPYKNQIKFGFYRSMEEPLTETLHLDVPNMGNVEQKNIWNLVLNEAERIIERDR